MIICILVFNGREPAEVDNSVCIHEHEDVKRLLVGETIKPNNVLGIQGTEVLLQLKLVKWEIKIANHDALEGRMVFNRKPRVELA